MHSPGRKKTFRLDAQPSRFLPEKKKGFRAVLICWI
jgi:hypothetical protein